MDNCEASDKNEPPHVGCYKVSNRLLAVNSSLRPPTTTVTEPIVSPTIVTPVLMILSHFNCVPSLNTTVHGLKLIMIRHALESSVSSFGVGPFIRVQVLVANGKVTDRRPATPVGSQSDGQISQPA